MFENNLIIKNVFKCINSLLLFYVLIQICCQKYYFSDNVLMIHAILFPPDCKAEIIFLAGD